MEINIARYDKERLPPEEIAKDVSALYANNYPPSHSPEKRAEDLSERDTMEKILGLVKEDRIFFVARDARDSVTGVLEMREVPIEDGLYIQLVWLIVDEIARRQGIGKKLHQSFEVEAQQIARGSDKPAAQLLGVHPNNTDAIAAYEKWGYARTGETSSDGKIFMRKDLPV